MQLTNSILSAFKIRGATNAILTYLEANSVNPSDLTVVTHSSGNHAQALALAAREHGVACHVVMPSNSPEVKKAAVRGYGAIVTECVPTLEAREEGVRSIINQLAASGKAVEFVPPYDDARIVTGQGTAALELIEQAQEIGKGLDILITPVGGGGLLSGSAIAAKGVNKSIWVVGAEPANADDAYRSFASKSFVSSVNPRTIADGLKTSLGELTFPLILRHVDAIHTVTEEQIVYAASTTSRMSLKLT
jgi:threonine dehydratase